MSDVTAPPIMATVEVHCAGIAAIANVTERYTADDWLRPTPCDEWTALDLAGDTITAAMMWHEALDDAAAGAPPRDGGGPSFSAPTPNTSTRYQRHPARIESRSS